MKVIYVFCNIISMKLGKIFIYREIRCNKKNILIVLSTKFWYFFSYYYINNKIVYYLQSLMA